MKNLYAVRYSRALIATKIREDDELVSVDISREGAEEVLVCTRFGYINRYDASEIRSWLPAFGVKALEMKSRTNDEVTGAHYFTEKDLCPAHAERKSQKNAPRRNTQGPPRQCRKQYVPMTKNRSNEIISSLVIHHKNANLDLDAYVYGSDGHQPLDYSQLRNATAPSGRKTLKKNIGNPEKLVITLNNDDFS